MTLDPDDARILRFLTAGRDSDRARAQGRSARRRFNQTMGNTPWSPVSVRGSRTWRDPTGDEATGNADRTTRKRPAN